MIVAHHRLTREFFTPSTLATMTTYIPAIMFGQAEGKQGKLRNYFLWGVPSLNNRLGET